MFFIKLSITRQLKAFQAFAFLAFLSIATGSTAQNYIDLVKFEYAGSSVNTFDSSETTTSLYELNGDITIPLVINDKLTLLPGFTYEKIVASFNPNRNEESLTGMTLKLGVNVTHNEKWSGTYLVLPKISSDMNELSKRDMQVGGVALIKYTKSAHLNYKFGVYGNGELFGPFIVPIFGMYYLSPTDKFEAKILLPLSVDLNYSISSSSRFGMNFKGQIRTYNVNTPIDAEPNRYLVRSTNELFSYFQYGLKNGINLQLGVGRSIGRTFRMYDEKIKFGLPLVYFGDNRTQLNTDFSDSWLYKASVFYRLKF